LAFRDLSSLRAHLWPFTDVPSEKFAPRYKEFSKGKANDHGFHGCQQKLRATRLVPQSHECDVAAVIDVNCSREYASDMRAVEFTTELGKKPVVTIPQEVADKLPKSGRARIIVLTPDDPEDALWRAGAYEQFVREDSPEDAVYDSY